MRSRSIAVGWASLAVGLLAPVAAQAGVSFSSAPYALPAADSEFHARIGAVSIVDLNADNHPDIVVYRGGGNVGQLYVLLNQGSGTFAPAQTYPVCANPDGGTMVTGQFDAGSAPDVILGCEAGTGHDELLGNGDGTLGASTHTIGPELNNAIALWPGDDGALPNLLVGVYDSSPPGPKVVLCHKAVNDLGASGGFPTCLPDTSSTDTNGDPDGHAAIGPAIATAHLYANLACPRDDVIFSPYQGSVRAWGLNPFGRDGGIGPCDSFSYTERDLALPADVVLAGISTADLSGDGSPDLLMNGGPQFNSDRLVALIWQNNAADLGGGFPPGQQPVVTPSITGIGDQQVADFDGDGIADVALVGSAPDALTGTLAVQRGHGDGSFDTPPVTTPVPNGGDKFDSTSPNRLAVGDLNGDNKPDLASVAQQDGAVTVLLNGSTPPPPPITPPVDTPASPVDTIVPVISALTLSHRTFRVGRGPTALAAAAPRGTTLRYRLSEAATVTFAFARKAPGRRKGSRCVAPKARLRHAKRCTRYVSDGRLTRAGQLGAGAVAFSGRIGRRALRLGAHRVTLTAKDPAGNVSRGARLAFRVVRR